MRWNPSMGIYCGCWSQDGISNVRASDMAASKRNRRAQSPIKILFCAAALAASFVVYWTVLSVYEPEPWTQTLWEGPHHSEPPPSSPGGPGAGYSGTSNASQKPSPPPSAPHSDAAPESADQGQQMYQAGEYYRLYGERQRYLLSSDATNLNFEAVKHTGDWKRAGDWDQGFLRMQETFKASLDLASAPAVPDFQVPAVQMPFQLPAVQMPAFPGPAFK